jgi:hypothetical protein
MVKFVDYTGKYPNLCTGILTLNIDGIDCKFGYGCEFQPFWRSGGCCEFRNNYEDTYIEQDEWIIGKEELPIQFRKYTKEIGEVFNKNVRWGCCGGCI